VKYSERTLGELACCMQRPEAHAKFGATRSPNAHLDVQGSPTCWRCAAPEGSRLVDPSGRSAINIVPLFETIEDLQASSAIMDGMLSLHDYRKLVDSRRRRAGSDARLLRQQTRMAASSLGLELYKAEIGLIEVFERHDVGCGCFTAAAVRSAAAVGRAMTPSSPSRRCRKRPDPVTEQGEIISSKYSNAEVGRKQSGGPRRSDPRSELLPPRHSAPRPEYLEAMDQLSRWPSRLIADWSMRRGFADYLWNSTVITRSPR